MGDVLIPQDHQQPCWQQCQSITGHKGLGDYQVGTQTQTVCACFELTTFQGFCHPSGHPKISTSFIPKDLDQRGFSMAGGDKSCSPARAQQEGWETKKQPAVLTQAVPKSLLPLKWYHTSNGILQHQQCERLNGNTQCYFKGNRKKKGKRSSQ